MIANCVDKPFPIENVWSTSYFLVCRYFPVSAHQEVLSHTCYRMVPYYMSFYTYFTSKHVFLVCSDETHTNFTLLHMSSLAV